MSQPSSKPTKLSRPTKDEYSVVEVEHCDERALAWIRPMWAGSLRNEGGWASQGGRGDYEQQQSRLIDTIVDDRATITLMLVHSSDPEVYFGFICGVGRDDYSGAAGEEGTGVLIHYVAVKSSLRGFGLSHILLDELIARTRPGYVECSHTTRSWRRIPRGRGVTYNPYALLWSLGV